MRPWNEWVMVSMYNPADGEPEILLAGIELMHMIAKGQMTFVRGTNPSAAVQFYELAT